MTAQTLAFLFYGGCTSYGCFYDTTQKKTTMFKAS